MVDKELKKEVTEKIVELLKPMTSKERGEYVAEITQLAFHISMMESMPESVKEAFKNNEKKVS